MDTIAPATPARPTELRHRRVRLELGPAAAAYACGHVRAAIAAWSVPVNPAVAILLTSDLVINAVTNGAGETITLGIRWSSGQFRVEVHDASVTGDSWETADADAERRAWPAPRRRHGGRLGPLQNSCGPGRVLRARARAAGDHQHRGERCLAPFGSGPRIAPAGSR